MGFGSLTGEFWFGLNALHCLTSQGQWELRIDLKLTNGTIIYLPYKKFAVGPASEQYPLTISGFTGYTTDPFYSHMAPTSSGAALNTMKFTKRDRNNDHLAGAHCSIPADSGRSGGWWYNKCARIHPNGQYNHKQVIDLNGQWYTLLFIEIKIRPKSCT